MNNMIGLMRVKNEARWIRHAIESMLPLCVPVLVLDDHSTDGTPEICRKAGAVVIPSPFEGLDEARDKDYLLELAAEYRPEWALMLDGDEILAPGAIDQIRASVDSGAANSYSVRFLYLWDDPAQVRVDGIYARARRQSIWKWAPRDKFLRTQFGGNFHCGSVPKRVIRFARECQAAILHLGYMLKEDRIRKYHWYNEQDPNNTAEDRYRHMVLGDVPELPATMRTRHAGPLTLKPLSEALCAATAR